MSKVMSIKNNLKCGFHMPKQLKTSYEEDEEVVHNLPPYSLVNCYPVDEYKKCPSNWMHGSDIVSSYFVGIEKGHGMWLDFNECFYHTHDVAIVLSIQGINPITGQKMVANNALRLEQYHKQCPIHNINFHQDRFCKKCGFKWPGQNYLATTGTPNGYLWLDGFRTPDGRIRQYIFTEEKIKGIASQLIGKERVFSIGIAFYISKNKKPEVSFKNIKRVMGTESNISHNYDFTSSSPQFGSFYCNQIETDKMLFLSNTASDNTALNNKNVNNITSQVQNSNKFSTKSLKNKDIKKLEIGAGALIRQEIYDDPKNIDYWESKPTGMIYVNYCSKTILKQILNGDKRKEKKDGFMQGLQIGN